MMVMMMLMMMMVMMMIMIMIMIMIIQPISLWIDFSRLLLKKQLIVVHDAF